MAARAISAGSLRLSSVNRDGTLTLSCGLRLSATLAEPRSAWGPREHREFAQTAANRLGMAHPNVWKALRAAETLDRNQRRDVLRYDQRVDKLQDQITRVSERIKTHNEDIAYQRRKIRAIQQSAPGSQAAVEEEPQDPFAAENQRIQLETEKHIQQGEKIAYQATLIEAQAAFSNNRSEQLEKEAEQIEEQNRELREKIAVQEGQIRADMNRIAQLVNQGARPYECTDAFRLDSAADRIMSGIEAILKQMRHL